MDDVDKNRVYESVLRLRSVGEDKDFTLDVEWCTPFGDVLREAGGDERKMPASYRTMLVIIDKVFSAIADSSAKAVVNENSPEGVIEMDIVSESKH